VPNILERVLDYGGREPGDTDADLPGPYDYTKDPADLKAGQQRKEDARQRRIAFMRDDFLHEMDHLERFIMKVAEQLSDVEIKQYFSALGRTKPEVKPFIHLGS
jgi:hypothetical protein